MPVKDKARSKKISNLMREAGLICGAKARSNGGQPCKNTPASLTTGNGRCRFHGGLSTGPKTPEGHARMLIGASLGGKTAKARYLQALAYLQGLDAI